MNTNSTDFACLVTGFLTDYLPHHRCYSRNTILSYRDTLKLFLRFLKEEKETSPNSFYIRDFKRELVIEFLEWYRNNGAGITAANQRLAALKAILNAKQYRRIWLYYAERKSVTEIARLEGVTKASVSLSLARAIKKISKKFAGGLKNT